MRFALIGDHPDGLAMARALVVSGRHELLAYSGPALGREQLQRWEIQARPIGDVEEILADAAIDAVIVAGKASDRPAQLRRALQSEHHVLCVHPADATPDIAYEANMIQADTKKVLMPLLPESFHPAVQRLAELLGKAPSSERLIEVERTATEEVLLETKTEGFLPAVPGWDILRLLGGEIGEIMGLAPEEDVEASKALLLAGQFERGGLIQATLLPFQSHMQLRWTVRTGQEQIELVFPDGWPAPARLSWPDETGVLQEASWDSWNPWTPLVEAFEAAVAGQPGPMPLWQDEIRCLELDDAARRSVARRRASTLEYQEATEEAGFKGTMTLVGCSLLWGSLVLLIMSAWVPWLAWLILPVFGVFLALQVLRWFVKEKGEN